jgi:TPR repeat protein
MRAVIIAIVGVGLVVGARAWRAHSRVAVAVPAPEMRALEHALGTMRDAAQARAAVARLEEAAAQGDVAADVALGRVWRDGTSPLGRDAARALHHFEHAAAARDATANYYLGVMTQRGEGVPADSAAAAQLFALAAAQGSAQAAFLLGNAYRTGSGVPRDERRAVALYQEAGERGNAAALQALALAYRYGELGLAADESAATHYQVEADHAAHEAPLP